MNPLETAEIGTTGLRVTRLGLGCAPLGLTDVELEAPNAVRRAYELGLRYFDTAPLYGQGRSERYVGQVLAGVPRDEFTLSTKVGRLLNPIGSVGNSSGSANVPRFDVVFDFSRDGVLRSLDESLQRLGLDRVDIAFIHDPDDHYRQAVEEVLPTLVELRSQGVVKAIGAGMNQWQMLTRFAEVGDFDCFLMAGRYTLLDQSGLGELLTLCESRRISVILGGPYNGGILASDLSGGAVSSYTKDNPDAFERARRIRDVCQRHGVPLKAAALQFGLGHPAVAATIPGARSVAETEENFRMLSHPIPVDLWEELRTEGFIRDDAPTPS